MPNRHLLAPDEIKVWYVRPEQHSNPDVISLFREQLSSKELDVLSSFRSANHRHTYLVAHGLLRGALSQVSEMTPANAWQFRTNPFNKPFIDQPTEYRGLHFNLSHTDGMAAISLSKLGPVGIDVEHPPQHNIEPEVAADILSPDEYVDYICQPANKRQHHLLRYWTLKEAYLKTTGLGLSAGFKSYEFDLTTPQPTIRFLAGIEATNSPLSICPRNWHFWQSELPMGHILAVGSHHAPLKPCRISIEYAHWFDEHVSLV
jgi:4'-phosphopantetheinyl transferase